MNCWKVRFLFVGAMCLVALLMVVGLAFAIDVFQIGDANLALQDNFNAGLTTDTVTITPMVYLPLVMSSTDSNGLRNSGIEEGFTVRGTPEVEVAVFWTPWWIPGTQEQMDEGWFLRPEYKPENAAISRRVHSGYFSQKQFSISAHHRAGLYQVISSITPGTTLTFSIWTQVWSSNQDDPDKCDESGNYRVWVGIDPTGGRDSESANVVWSEPVMTCNEWVYLHVTTEAQTSNVTVFTRGEPEYRVKHNEVYWDDAYLTVQ